MAYLIDLPTFKDSRGELTVIEKIIPFEIKRVYYIYNVLSERGGHRHKKTIQALISIGGTARIYVKKNNKEELFILDNPTKCLILNPDDWHNMIIKENSTLLVFASEYYDKNDYIYEDL